MSKKKWEAYVMKFMANTLKNEGINQIIIQTEAGETLAVWQDHGEGHIYEGRSASRLAADVAKLDVTCDNGTELTEEDKIWE